MMRILHSIAITCLIASAAYAYSIKYDTLYYAEEIAKLNVKLRQQHDAIAVAKAEWALLTRPERLQALAERNVDLQPMQVAQLARFSDLPARPPKDDEIGRKLDMLMSLEATATPKDKRGDSPADGRMSSATRTPGR
jgi:hypothetical protein